MCQANTPKMCHKTVVTCTLLNERLLTKKEDAAHKEGLAVSKNKDVFSPKKYSLFFR